jgi:putative resolvase
MYTPGEFGKKIHVSVKTLQRWDREGVLRAHRTASNRRYYTQEDLQKILPEERQTRRRTIAYCRVSSAAHKPDLMNQRKHLAAFCQANAFEVDEWMSEIGGGLNFGRKRFLALVDAILAGEVAMLIIAHKDRLARFGFPLLQHLCETHDCRLLVMNTEELSPEQELVQDLMAITHCFSARLYGLHNYRKALEKALKDEHGTPNQDELHP